MNICSRLCLGTAQFGGHYGVANSRGQVEIDEIEQILDVSVEKGIDTLDTAISYGESEKILGELGVTGWNIISKLPELLDQDIDTESWIRSQVDDSLRRLKISRLDGLLLHHPSQLLGRKGKEISQTLQTLKSEGVVEKIGVSIYDPEILAELFRVMDLDIVQAPYNVFDDRIVSSGWARKIEARGVELHLRSVFLQGLLLLPRSEVPQHFREWMFRIDAWHKWLTENARDPVDVCLNHSLSCGTANKVLVGVDSKKHLLEIISASTHTSELLSYPRLSCDDKGLIEPSNWRLN